MINVFKIVVLSKLDNPSFHTTLHNEAVIFEFFSHHQRSFKGIKRLGTGANSSR